MTGPPLQNTPRRKADKIIYPNGNSTDEYIDPEGQDRSGKLGAGSWKQAASDQTSHVKLDVYSQNVDG